jgi:hypothetical protein
VVSLHRFTRWRSLRHFSTSRKVAGSIPDCVIAFFHWLNPSTCSMALVLTQPRNRNEYQENLLGVKAVAAWADNLTTCGCRLSSCLAASASWNPQGLSRDCLFLFPGALSLSQPVYRKRGWISAMGSLPIFVLVSHSLRDVDIRMPE